MKKLKEMNTSNKIILPLVIIFYIFSNIYYQYSTTTQIQNVEKNFENENSALTQKVSDIETVLLAAEENNLTLAEALEEAKENARDLSREFERVNDNVDDLEKIAKTDPELLQKYSKVFFLNEHYAPSDLDRIDKKWTWDKNRTYQIHGKVSKHLEDLLEDAEDDGLDLLVVSAFRSFGEQAELKGNYTVQYGAGSANTFSADQGYSEHQLGTTVDFTTPTVAGTFSGFAQTEEYKWLRKNAQKYGFTMSYPENNQFYEFEPWHWRFVGKDLADDLHDDNRFFYDLTQREIDKYILDLF